MGGARPFPEDGMQLVYGFFSSVSPNETPDLEHVSIIGVTQRLDEY